MVAGLAALAQLAQSLQAERAVAVGAQEMAQRQPHGVVRVDIPETGHFSPADQVANVGNMIQSR